MEIKILFSIKNYTKTNPTFFLFFNLWLVVQTMLFSDNNLCTVLYIFCKKRAKYKFLYLICNLYLTGFMYSHTHEYIFIHIHHTLQLNFLLRFFTVAILIYDFMVSKAKTTFPARYIKISFFNIIFNSYLYLRIWTLAKYVKDLSLFFFDS